MKKIIAILLLLQFLTNNSFVEELTKLPALFTHFYHHSHEHNDTHNFLTYLVKHYSENHEENEHQGEDEKCNLPFKNCDGCCINIHVPLLAFMPSYDEAEFVFNISTNEQYTFKSEKIKSLRLHSIWQPPKFS